MLSCQTQGRPYLSAHAAHKILAFEPRRCNCLLKQKVYSEVPVCTGSFQSRSYKELGVSIGMSVNSATSIAVGIA